MVEMTTNVQECPIWGVTKGVDAIGIQSTRVIEVRDSPRTGGAYMIPEVLVHAKVSRMTDTQKAQLTTWLLDQRMQGVELPEITDAVIEHVITKLPLAVHERADRLLKYIAQQSGTVAARVWVADDTLSAYAWSESTTWAEVDYYMSYLRDMGWVYGETTQIGYQVQISVAGYSHIAEQATNVDSSQAFVAMWFDPSLTRVFEDGIRPAIEEAGFSALRIDQKEHVNRIDDEIIAEIRRSRFLVADFTQGPGGARGGVYYEAGFAHGLGLPVIFTCREDCVGNLHFDTNHYNHIVWTDPTELRDKLRNRIVAVLGQGAGDGSSPM